MIANNFIPNITKMFAIICGFAFVISGCGGGSASDQSSEQSSAPDTTPPTISSIGPGNGAGTNESIIVTFSEKMDPATINSTSFLVSGGAIGTVSYDTVAEKAYFTPAGNLTPNTRYDVTITSGVKDRAGNAMAGYYPWSFTTGSVAAAGTWQEISSDSPMLPGFERAVWSGSEMLIFGGFTHANRFNPSKNTWASNNIWSEFRGQNI